MPRPDKVAAVAEIKERFENAQAVFLAEYAGLSVKQQQELRRGLREQDAEFKVVKMTLARRATADLDVELDELLLGPTGLAFADGDPVSAAKVLKDFAANHEVFAVKGGVLGTDFLTPERINALAEIAPREELLSMLAGAMKAPMTSMAGLLAALPRGAATMFQQLLEKKESGEAPAPADAAEAVASEDAASEDVVSEDEGSDATEAAVAADADEAPEAEIAEAPEAEADEPEADELVAEEASSDVDAADEAEVAAAAEDDAADAEASTTSEDETAGDDAEETADAADEAADDAAGSDDADEEDEAAAKAEEE